jgi:phenylpropionate dioxygenase-like ring-hydroxylating dioxygenase large terminal subunit
VISRIPAADYVSEEVFALENRTLFANSWQFACLRRDCANDGDFMTLKLGEIPVLVRNFEGKMRAFLNVCSHRHCEILSAARGNGMVKCPYHGWIYNAEGIPYSIPSRPRFDDLTPEVLKGLALAPFRLEACGEFLFVGPPDGEPLREFLGEAYEELERIPVGAGAPISSDEFTFGANWKVAVENTLESYHVGFVHSESFAKLGAKGMDFKFWGKHSKWEAPLSDTVAAQSQALLPYFEPRSFPIQGYYHLFIFPNLTVASTFGTSFSVQRFVPLTAESTRLDTTVLWAPDGGGKAISPGARTHMARSIGEFNRQVFSEDKAICEAVQRGARNARQPGMLSDEESRVSAFQDAYLASVGTRSASTQSGNK